MSDTITLELKQSEAQNEFGAGDWESVVQEKITLYQGDQLVMNKVFIDTQATSNEKINIDKNLTLKYEFLYYFNYWNIVNGNTAFYNFANGDKQNDLGDPTDPNNKATGSCYMPQVIHRVGAGGGVKYTDSIEIVFVPFTKIGTVCPAFDIQIGYVDGNGTAQTITAHVKEFTAKGFSTASTQRVTLSHPIMFKDTGGNMNPATGLTLTPSPADMVSKFKVNPTLVGTIANEDEIFCQPLKGIFSMSLPKGSYSPVDLCNYINTEITKATNPVGNSIEGLYSGVGDGNPFLIQTPWKGMLFGDPGGGVGFNSIEPTAPTLCGASLVELTYIDAQQKFAWDALHMPMYDTNGVASVRYQSSGIGADARIQRQQTGIMFTHLGAVDDNGNYYDFWEDKLGFILENLYPKTTGLLQYSEAHGTSASKFFGEALTPPAQFTIFQGGYQEESRLKVGGNATIDALVPKGKLFTVAPVGATGDNFYLPVPVTEPAFFAPTNEVNTRLMGANSVLGATAQFGYFLIEVSSKFRNVVTGKSANKNNLVGIVGRFYEVNSYTQGTEGDSLVYTHSGQPMYLDSFKCRILDANKNLADNLGDDNTIFLTINRSPKNQIHNLPPALQEQALKEAQAQNKK